RTPLTEADPVAPPRACGDEPADLAAVLRHREGEGSAAEHLIGLGPQHRAHVGAEHAYVAVLERDTELADPARGCHAGHFDVGDALQPHPARVHHRRHLPRPYSPPRGPVPFLAP